MFIDTHSHLYLPEFETDINEVIERCREQAINEIYLPNIDQSSIRQIEALVKRDKEMFKPMMGLHPCYVKEDYKQQLKVIHDELASKDYVGVGEIGIDLYWDKTFATEQSIAFKEQIYWAREMNLPIVIHSRDSLDLTIKTVEELQDGNLRGIFHCFNGTEEQGARIVDLGFYLGIGGVITFKNAGVDKTVANLPLDKMVLETDAPYLSPVPYRGKRNESSYISLIANKLSEIFSVSVQEVGSKTSRNTREVFGEI